MIFNQFSKDDDAVFGLCTFTVETTIQLKIPSKTLDQRRKEKKEWKYKKLWAAPVPP